MDILNDLATQIVDDDCQLPPGDDLQGEKDDDFMHLTDTVPVDDYLLEDAFETQLANLGGGTKLIDLADDTQMMDYDFQTQVMDYVGETQLVDFADETLVMNFSGDTQVMDCAGETQVMDCDGETQVIVCDGETQALDDVECVKTMPSVCLDKSGAQQDDAVSGKDTNTKMHNNDSGASRAAISNEDNSGSACRDFTSIRAASVRASGLAARARGTSRTASCTNGDKSSLEEKACVRGGSSIIGRLLQRSTGNIETSLQNKDASNLPSYRGNDKQETATKYKFGTTVVRKLFLDDQISEGGRSEANANDGDNHPEMNELISSQNCFAGLSYANSQEPGEQSQAEALEVVDKFFSVNLENNEPFGFQFHNTTKPKAISSAKGSRDLAKVSILKRVKGRQDIYDWDDTREDDCGGEFFLKKKDLFFDDGAIKRGCPDTKSVKNVADHGNEKELSQTKKKLKNMYHSDSRLMYHRLRSKRETLQPEEDMLPKNLNKEFDEGLETDSVHNVDDNDSSKDMETIGPDTQLAAEAMENLCFEVKLADYNGAGCNKGTRSTTKATRKNNRSTATKVVLDDECLTVEEQCSPRVGAVTRQAKRRKISDGNVRSVSSEKCKNVMKIPVKQKSAEKLHMDKQPYFCSPVAHRTRKRSETACSEAAGDSSNVKEELNNTTTAHVPRKRKTSAECKNVESGTITNVRQTRSAGFENSSKSRVAKPKTSEIESVTITKVRKMGSAGSEKSNKSSVAKSKASEIDAVEKSSKLRVAKSKASDIDALEHISGKETGKGNIETSPQERCRTSDSSCITPPTCAKPINTVSPIIMGDEYHKQSCRKNLSRSSLVKEINNLETRTPENRTQTKDLRKRKDVTSISVLFSQHLDDDIVKQQQKILARLGGAIASSISDATHFVADEFVRTRNILEAIAFGKPVVTHLWLDCCGQANCLIDEKNYILRDVRKEKEFGFSLPASLSRACERPLLKGYKVFITPNTKPGKDILATLVKAVQGLVVERLGRSVLNDEKLPDDLLILSCEDDYDICTPFLEKGGAVYSSELLLNGIVKQKLEHERHLLFADSVRRTRSTLWLKKKNQYYPVTKS